MVDPTSSGALSSGTMMVAITAKTASEKAATPPSSGGAGGRSRPRISPEPGKRLAIESLQPAELLRVFRK
jgi:hypothetical protein